MRPRRSRGVLRIAFAGLAVLVAACGGGDTDRPALRIYCAASFAEAAAELASAFRAEPFTIVPGPSNVLATQLLDGAPGDLFLTASPRWLEELERDDRILGIRRGIAGNVLVCATAVGSPLATAGLDDLESLARVLGPGDRVAIGDAGVPVGEYARQSLSASEADLADHLVGLTDARAVLQAVRSGNVAAGFVYRTDLDADETHELFALRPATHDPAIVLGVALTGSSNATRADDLLEDMVSARGQALLREAGFVPYPENEDRR